MNRNKLVFIECPIGADGRHQVAINIDEIASYEDHMVSTAYSYAECTLVTLKSGVQHDCYISKSEFESRLQAASSL